MNYRLFFTKQAVKDLELVKKSSFGEKVKRLLTVLEEDPYQPPFEKLVGDLAGAYSRRINLQHRLVYQIDEEHQAVKILRLWTHYNEN